MGRFFVTNSKSAFDQARRINKKAGLEENGIISGDGFQGIVYDKRAISVDNIHSSSDGAQLASVGTVLHDGTFGTKSLIPHYTENNLLDLRNHIQGHYAIIENQKENAKIYGDPMGIYDIYYTNQNKLFVSNSLSLIAQCGDFSVNELGLLEYNIFVNNITTNTPYDDINRLDRSHYIVIDDGNISLEKIPRRENPSNFKFNSFNEAVKTYSDRISNIMNDVSQSELSIGIQLTGGLDSRTVLAGLLDADISPLLMVGVGTGQVKLPDENDREINSMIADHFDLDQYLLDWNANQSEQNTATIDSHLDKYGFHYRFHGLSPSAFKEYEGEITPYPDVIMIGNAAGFTNSAPWETFDSSSSYDIQDLLSLLSNYPYQNILKNTDDFENYLVQSMKELNHIDLHDNMSGREIIGGEFKLYPRSEGWTMNALNEFTYVLAPLNFSYLLEPLIEIPNEYRKSDRFQISVISNLIDDLLDFPINSGGEALKVVEDDTGPSTLKLIPRATQGDPPSKKLRANMRRIVNAFPTTVASPIKSLWRMYLLDLWNRAVSHYPSDLHELDEKRIKEFPISDHLNFKTGAIGAPPLHRLYLDSYATYKYAQTSSDSE